MILIIDNYDSFTYNLYQYLGEMYPDIKVVRNDEVTIEDIEKMNPEGIIVSPGPGYPKDAGISIDVIKHFSGKLPILGVCLGHQSIGVAFGGKVVKARELMHGKSSEIEIDNTSEIFKGLPEKIKVGRYHSLIIDEVTLPECLKVIGKDVNGQIMAIEHKEYQTYGVQFHPESILTDNGKIILKNYLDLIEVNKKKMGKDEDIKRLQGYIARVVDKNNLTFEESKDAMNILMSGNATDAQIAALLTALRMKGETSDEISGLARGMRDKAVKVEDEKDAIEIVGTGGDLAKSFNISTTSSFVIAASGVKVAKHGNRSVSSKSGAADVLEALGAKIKSTPEIAKKSLDTIGITFLFAQSYHKSMKYVGPTRKQLGIRTVFNILGPLTNPAETDYILLGCYDTKLCIVLANVLIKLGIKRAMVISGEDVLDEVSISAPTYVAEVKDGTVREYEIKPEDFGLTTYSKSEIAGGTPEENAEITKGILKGEIKGAKREIVLLNSACAMYTIGRVDTIADGVKLAAELIDNGAALKKLNEYVKFTNENGEVE